MKASVTKKNTQETNGSKKSARRVVQQRKRQQERILKLSAILAGLTGLALFIYLLSSNQRGTVGDIEDVRVFANMERGHSNESVTYEQIPPAGGVHNPSWQNCGVYYQPVANEYAVHSLEHGAIWITYQPGISADQLQMLVDLTRQSGYRLLSPYPGLPSNIVLSAWGYQLNVDTADDLRISQFISKYERNPNGPEPGAPCTGGTGQPG